MIIADERKTLKFSISGYQYPHAKPSTGKNYDYDANWLIVKVDYENGQLFSHEDPCMTTGELRAIHKQMDLILSGKITCFFSKNMEPYFRFAAARTNGNYVVQIALDILHDNRTWETWSAVETLDRNRFVQIRDEFRQLSITFPER